MDNGTLFNMKDLNAKGAEERNAVLVRAQAALKTLGEVRPLITVAPKRTGGYAVYFRAPLGQMLGVGLQTRLSDDPEIAALQAIELLPKCVPFNPDVITGRRRRRQPNPAPMAPMAPIAATPPAAAAEPIKPPTAGGAGRMAVYYESLSAMLDDIGEGAVFAMVQLIKAARRPG